MPCYDGRTAAEERAEYDQARAREKKQYMEEFTHNSPVAELLCMVMGIVEKKGILPTIHGAMSLNQCKELGTWYDAHLARDAEKQRIKDAAERLAYEQRDKAVAEADARLKQALKNFGR